MTPPPSPSTGNPVALLTALLTALGCLFIWVATPYNNVLLEAGYISDNYVPVAALFCVFLTVLVINPLLRRFAPEWALRRSHLGISAGVLLVASIVPGQGLHRFMTYLVTYIPAEVRDSQVLGDIYAKMNLPSGLFPTELGYNSDASAARWFVGRLPVGESIPWGAWVLPAMSWGVLLVSLWMLMIGISLIMFCHWRKTARLEFPLLTVYQSVVEEPEKDHLFPRVFRSSAFWWAAGIVFVLHLLVGLQQYFPNRVPAIPLDWNLSSYFTEPPLRYLPWPFKSSRIYFLFVGVAFFMPKRISFSIWMFQLSYALYQALARAYAPPFYGGCIHDQRQGAIMVFVLAIMWLDRRRWLQVARQVLRTPQNESEYRDRNAAWMLIAGMAGLYGWLLWVGVQWHWGLGFVVIGFLTLLTIARVIAETGTPIARIYGIEAHMFATMMPTPLLTTTTVFLAMLSHVFFSIHTRFALSPMATHAIGLDEDGPPRRHWRMAWVFLGVLFVGFLVAGAVHMRINYNHDSGLQGGTLNTWGAGQAGAVNRFLVRFEDAKNWPQTTPYNRWGHMGFGAGLAGFLQWACLHFPKWPLHPIGLILVFTWHGQIQWWSIFLGWLAKVLILRYGGAKLHREAQPFFIGLVIGETLAAVFWFLVPMLLVALGHDYMRVMIQPT